MYALGNAFARGGMHFQLIDVAADPQSILTGSGTVDGLKLRLSSGTRRFDLMGDTSAVLRLISDRFVGALRDCRASGWSAAPVQLIDKRGGPVPGYHVLVVSGRSGPLDRRRTRIVRQEPPVPNGEPTFAELGLRFDPSTWDGSDVFVPQHTSVVCLTERVKAAIEGGGLANIVMQPLSEYQIDLYSEYPRHRSG